ncbi:OmpA/MotB membrane protein [Haloferula helveola]|uniref:OmpA/MotB membrane protein n=1 Tax=Haloferula helveola TaxID=490095 RepID=A0ABN6H2S2_9BACT|nr:OmpA/MotB membrane protein [Haloferula helveola]
MSRSQLPLLAVALVIGALATLLILLRNHRPPAEAENPPPPPKVDRPVIEVPESDAPPMPELAEQEVDTPESPMDALQNAGVGLRSANPGELIGKIGEALEAGDFATAGRLIGKGALDAETRAKLAAMAGAGPLRFARPEPAREVGEMEINARSRWALYLDGAEPGRDRIFFDLVRDQGRWGVQSMTLPPSADQPVPKAVLVDSLGIADAFLQAVLRQEFEMAKEFVDSSKVSDAKIAGLCILFEEGGYKLRPQKPLRAMFQRENLSGYLTNVLAGDGSEIAQFSMTLQRPEGEPNWKVAEINLQQLLADYARRIGGGDVHYTPLLKNPKGGDTLVLYFDFDTATLTPRTERQLGIVADLLRTDPGKKLTISGHTDALGTEDYNQSLSGRRARSVKEYLVTSGVAEDQIETVAAGQTAPRQPNFTEDGEDNPDGRRVNRRSEIYLDF